MKIYLVAVITLFSCVYTGKKQMYVIRGGYIGKVLILYNRSDGAPDSVANGRHYLNIPPSGIIKTQLTLDKGYIVMSDLDICYDGNGYSNKKLIMFDDRVDYKNPDSLRVIVFTAGGFSNEEASYTTAVQFAIDSVKNMDKYDDFFAFKEEQIKNWNKR